MEVMSDAAKKELHDLVDTLPASEVVPARRYLEFLREHGSDSDAQQNEQGPFETMSDDERAALNASIDRGLAQAKAGQGRPIEEFLDEL